MIPKHVLSIPINTIEEDTVPLSTLLYYTTNQEVEHAEFVVAFDDEKGDTLHRFTAWTKDHVLSLIKTAHGDYLLKNDRNFKS